MAVITQLGVLHVGDFLVSKSGNFVGWLDIDGVFRMAWGKPGTVGWVFWQTSNAPAPGPNYFMKTNTLGMIAIYQGDESDPNAPMVWYQPAGGAVQGPTYALIEDSGRLALYRNTQFGPALQWGSDIWFSNDGTVYRVQSDMSDSQGYMFLRTDPALSNTVYVHTRDDNNPKMQFELTLLNDGVRFLLRNRSQNKWMFCVGDQSNLTLVDVPLMNSVLSPGGKEYPGVGPYRRAIRPAFNTQLNFTVGGTHSSGDPVALAAWKPVPGHTVNPQFWTLKPDPFPW